MTNALGDSNPTPSTTHLLTIRCYPTPVRPLILPLLLIAACGGESASSDTTGAGEKAVVTSSVPPMSSSTAPVIEATSSTGVLFDFAQDSSDGWFIQNDTVMGGVSSSTVGIEGGEMVFSGNVSLDNNGGFASVRGPLMESTPDGDAIIIDASGDGRTYLLQLRTPTDSYIARWVPIDGPQTLPFEDFTASSWRLDPIPAVAPLTSTSIGQIAIYILDKQVGEFSLRIRSISVGQR
jgi:hypothetical protein